MQRWLWSLVPALMMVMVMVTAGAPGAAASGGHGEGSLDELMKQNRQHFTQLVNIAFFQSLEKRLGPADYQGIREQAEAITAIARQARESHSHGGKFDALADELEEHAEKVTGAAAERDLPEVNVEIGEMAEYCAECHNTFRWPGAAE